MKLNKFFSLDVGLFLLVITILVGNSAILTLLINDGKTDIVICLLFVYAYMIISLWRGEDK